MADRPSDADLRAEAARRLSRRPFGVRLYLSLAFALVALLTATLAYLIVRGYGEGELDARSSEIAVGRTVRVAQQLAEEPQRRAQEIVSEVSEQRFSAWKFDPEGRLVATPSGGADQVTRIERIDEAVSLTLGGSRFVETDDEGVTLVGIRVFRGGELAGAVVARAEEPVELVQAREVLRGNGLTAAIIAVGVAVLVGAVIASAITGRVKRLASAAGRIATGHLDEPTEGIAGRDEITELGVALETMRVALRDTFDALRSERNRLSAIFDSLESAVIVASPDGDVRFANTAARAVTDADGRAIPALKPWLRRAARDGSAEQSSLVVGDRVYAVGARELPEEGAVLAVVRDRTEELRREVAEREFVSNAAHELRNPIAGMSGSIEVLRSGAKDDPQAREHFLSRLEEDVERVSRLTQALLVLARLEAVGEGGSEVVEVDEVVAEAAGAAEVPEGIELEVASDTGLNARGDRALLRQVLDGLLVNAFKHTPAPGTVTLRARAEREETGASSQIVIEVMDTGTGIAADDRDRIFERFYRGSGSLEREGFGLGLAIAKRMVDVMGGEIGVESAEGRGSTFSVRLPATSTVTTPVA